MLRCHIKALIQKGPNHQVALGLLALFFDNNVPHGIVVFPFPEKMDQSFAGFDYNNINI